MKFPECFREVSFSNCLRQSFGPSPAVLAANIGRATEPRLAGSRGSRPILGLWSLGRCQRSSELTVQIRSPGHNDFWSKPEYTSTLFLCLV